MKQIVLMGMGAFGTKLLSEFESLGVETLIIDKDKEKIERLKSRATAAYITDVTDPEVVKKILPEDVDAVILDLGQKIETSILVTNYLVKMNTKNIIVKAETEVHREILEGMGAHQVVIPDHEAARRVALPLASSDLLSYLPISKSMVIAEIALPKTLSGKTLIEADLRNKFHINVIAVRTPEEGEYIFPTKDYRFTVQDAVLVAGREENVLKLTKRGPASKKKELFLFFQRVFRIKE